MSVPTNFKTAITAKNVALTRWLEIAGIPYAYGTSVQSGSFFAARSSLLQFLGIRAQLATIPRNLDQTVDTLEGGALTTGTTDFEITDNDGEVTKWTGVGYESNRLVLNGSHTASATTINFFGSAAAYSANDYIYIGTETIKIGAKVGQTFTGCTRGLFRSTKQAFGSGYPISLRPYTFANRRCWYNEVAIDKSTGAALSSQDPDRCVRFAGTLRSMRLKDNSYSAFILSAESIDRELNRNCFRTFRSFKMVGTKISDVDGNNGNTQVYGYKGYSGGYDFLYNFDGSLFEFDEIVLLRIEDEIFAAVKTTTNGAANPKLQLLDRALFGTEAVAHNEGALIQEVIPVVRYSTDSSAHDLNWEQRASKFTSAATTNSPLLADHPLLIVLQVLLSRKGHAENWDGVNRNYDVLPEDWGMNVDYTRVDIQGIEAAAMEEPTLRFTGVLEQPLNFCDFMRQFLKMAGYYYIVEVGDRFTIRRLRPPKPDVSSTSIGNSNRIRKFYSGWDANWSGAVREIIFKFGWDIVNQKYKRITIFKLNDGDVYSEGLARTLNFESKFVYPGSSGIPGELFHDTFDVDQWLLTRRDFYTTRYGRPPPIIRERLDYSFIDMEIGDIVSVTHPNLPDVAAGATGMTNSIGEVVSKSIDEVSKTIEFQILMTGWMLGHYRFVPPCIDIIGQEDGAAFLCSANQFTEPVGPQGGTTSDATLETSSGSLIKSFPVNMIVWVWTPDYKHKQQAKVSALTDGEIILYPYPSLLTADWDAQFTDVVGGDNVPQVGCHVTHTNYDDTKTLDPHTNEIAVSTYAFGADANDLLGTDNDPAHKYFPI